MIKQKHIINNIDNINYGRINVNYCNHLRNVIKRGFLMIFIESHQVAYNMSERFHFIMCLFS